VSDAHPAYFMGDAGGGILEAEERSRHQGHTGESPRHSTTCPRRSTKAVPLVGSDLTFSISRRSSKRCLSEDQGHLGRHGRTR
jgi:hypothetical protein